MKNLLVASLFLLAACSGYKTPSVSSNPSKMSGDTLCYRYAYAKSDPALAAEVKARGLDCRQTLEDQGAAVGESRW
jgi:hypothetical protein